MVEIKETAAPSSPPLSDTPRSASKNDADGGPRILSPPAAAHDVEKRLEPGLDSRSNTDNGDAAGGDHTSPFAFTPTKLHELSEARTTTALDALGGLPGLAAGLRTNLESGLSADEDALEGAITIDEAIAAGREGRAARPSHRSRESRDHLGDLLKLGTGGAAAQAGFSDRVHTYGENVLPKRKQKSFLRLAWIAFNDKLIILLSISATISLALGIYQSVDPEEGTSNVEWVDGVTVVVAILVIVFASAATDWQKNHKFEKLNERKEQRDVTVVRSGKPQRISIHHVLVGDLMRVEAGDIVAVDGVLVHAAGIQVNESSISGESELVHKHPVSEMHPTADPFLLSGTTVSAGYGTYLVTSVGVNSTYGRTLMSLRHDVEETPLQQRLGKLAKQLITVGAIAGSIFFLIIFIRFLVELKDKEWTPAEKAKEFFQVLILAVTVIVITVPEGLALAVTIALAFATSRMLKDNNLVRLIRSCEIMGNATCVCSDKTGTLTRNDMVVVVGTVGRHGQFSDHTGRSTASDNSVAAPRAPASETDSVTAGSSAGELPVLPTSSALTDTLDPAIKQLIRESVALNSTAFESDSPASAAEAFIGSSTESALLKFARNHLGMGPLNEERANNTVLEMIPFDSERKWMAAVARLGNGKSRLFVKGAAEMVLEMTSRVISLSKDTAGELSSEEFTKEDAKAILDIGHGYATQMLRPITLAYKDIDDGDAGFTDLDNVDPARLRELVHDLTFIGVFGIQDPLRPEVIRSVRQCQEAGVFVRMVTGDSFLTAKSIATECGIYTAGGIAMDGPTFRRLTPAQLDLVIPRLQVLARSSPQDKLTLVTHLKGMGETVAVTGDGTNDALALKAADVGFAMGIQGTEIAKEAASIILLDDNFASIVKALSWGRTVNAAVKKFLQFQFTINITAGTLTVISTLAGDTMFTVVQLLWLNLIMDIFASLGLATDYPSKDFLKRKPEPRGAPIVTVTMWKMVLAQAIYQLAVVFTLHYAGEHFFTSERARVSLQTMVFNTYVFMQLFNQHNCRRVDNHINIYYQGVLKNPWFLGVQCLTLAGQMVIVWKGGSAFDTHPPTGAQWGWTIFFGVITIPLGMAIRQVPDRYVATLFRGIKRGLSTVFGPLAKLIPKRWRKKAEDEVELGVESWVLRTGSALLRPVNYRWGPTASNDHHQPVLGGGAVIIPPISPRKAEPDFSPPNSGKPIDLLALIIASRAKRGKGPVESGLEEHPDTKDEDLELFAGAKSDSKGPPSQDPRILKLLNLPM